MIPEEKKAAVCRALQECLGVSEFEDVRRITRGLSSDLVFRIVVRGAPYLLRVMTQIDERMDPVRIFSSMIAASRTGITPVVRYANVEDGVSITDFVEAAPLSLAQGLALLPATLRDLHALPRFSKEFNYVTPHKYFIWRFREAGLLPAAELKEVFSRYEQLCATYPRVDSDMVSCHMDLKPENILFDGQRVWLVDWQAAFVNDRYFDLAVLVNFVAANEGDESLFLERYFGRRPNEYEIARFFLMRQFVHLFYTTVFLLLASAGKPMSLTEALPSFRDFHDRIWAGKVSLADNNTKILYGMVHWRRLQQNINHSRFSESLRVVSEHTRNTGVVQRLFPAA
jgi:hypothetical protein